MIKGAGFMDFYTAIVLLVIVMVVVNGIDIFSNRLIGIRMKRNSLITCSLIVFALFFEWLGVKVNGVASHIEIHKQAKLLEFSIAPLIAVFATVSYSKIRHPKIITAVMTAHIVFEAVALHFGWVISVDSSGRYHRGPLYPIYILVFSISIVYYMICVLKTDTQYYPKPSLVLLAILAFLAIGICFQMVNSDIRTVYICVAMSNYFFYTHRYKTILQMDGLTHLLNRRCFEKDIEKIKPPTRLLLLDVDDFKGLNDAHGHMFGDECLKEIAAVLRSIFGRVGTCYRFGGDEFCVIMTRNVGEMENMIGAFNEQLDKRREKNVRIPTVCIGFSGCDTSEKHILDAFQEADDMLYRAKTEKKSKTYQ